MTVPLLNVERRWECPACDLTDVTRRADVHTQMHNCAGMSGLSVPMVPAGSKAKQQRNEREDYVGGELVARDGDGRVVMSVTTVRDDGEDCTVYAPTVSIDARA